MTSLTLDAFLESHAAGGAPLGEAVALTVRQLAAAAVTLCGTIGQGSLGMGTPSMGPLGKAFAGGNGMAGGESVEAVRPSGERLSIVEPERFAHEWTQVDGTANWPGILVVRQIFAEQTESEKLGAEHDEEHGQEQEGPSPDRRARKEFFG